MSKQAVANKGGRGARQRILDTAAELFYRDGINALSTNTFQARQR
jgi:AcrR family transcriptional regulator